MRAAREQANRDTELNRLKAQLKSLREMLRESHKVLPLPLTPNLPGEPQGAQGRLGLG